MDSYFRNFYSLIGLERVFYMENGTERISRRNRRNRIMVRDRKETTQKSKKKPGLSTQIFIALLAGALLGVVIHYWIPSSYIKDTVICLLYTSAMHSSFDFCDFSRRAFSEIQLRHGIALFHTA